MRLLILLATALTSVSAFAADPNPFKPNSSPTPMPAAPGSALPANPGIPGAPGMAGNNGLPPPGAAPVMPEAPPVLPGQEIKETGERIGTVNGRAIYRSANNRYFIEPTTSQK